MFNKNGYLMLKFDCRYFPGDRPCRFNKEKGIKCDSCEQYKPILFKILIIKLDAVGDVLRTTSILPPLKLKYPDSHITWCTRINSRELFTSNSYVDELIIVDVDAWFRLSKEEFDLVINLDSSKISCSIASYAKGKDKKGFILSEKGSVIPVSDEAKYWLLMSAFDEVKQKNTRTYQQIIYDIIGLDEEACRPIYQIKEFLIKEKINYLRSLGLNENKLSIGVNVGVGTKWPSKGLPLENWKKLIELLKKEQKFNILLLGGSDELNLLNDLKSEYSDTINTGGDNDINGFAAIVSICDVIVTADTFALHLATALNKKIIALFGPTSIDEIELYGNGIKLRAENDCKCFYQKECTEEISCMQKISAEKIYSALNDILMLGK